MAGTELECVLNHANVQLDSSNELRTHSTSLPANCFREYFFFVSRKGAKYRSCFSECIFVGNIIFPYICEAFEMMSFNLGVPDLNALSF